MHKLEIEILLFFVNLFVPVSDEPDAIAEQDKMASRDGVAGCVGGTTDDDFVAELDGSATRGG